MEKATEKQLKFMKNLNLEIPENLTKIEARLAIDRALKKSGKPQYNDMQKPEMTTPENKDKMRLIGYAKDLIVSGKTLKDAVIMLKQLQEEF